MVLRIGFKRNHFIEGAKMRVFKISLILALLVAPFSLNAQSISEGKNGNAVKAYSVLAGCSDGTNQRAQKCSSTGAPLMASDKTEDAAHASGDTGSLSLSVRSDNAASSAGTDGDYAAILTDALGKLWVTGSMAEDVASAGGDIGMVTHAVRDDALAANAGVSLDGDYLPLRTDNIGALWTDSVGSTSRVCASIVPDTNAFAANDIVGPPAGASGLLTFASIFRTSVNSGILTHVSVVNSEIDGIAYDLCIFNADPSGSTVAANGPFTLVSADRQKLIGCFGVAEGRAFAAYEMYQVSNVNMAVDAAATSLYAILRTTGAPTWAAAQTVDVCLTVIQD